jgi:hypothetical protein
MPYHIGEKGSHNCAGYPVIKDSDNSVVSCNKTLQDAKDHLAALYIHVVSHEKSADGFSPPQGVRSNAKRGLELRDEFKRGGTMVGVARARDLSNGKSLPLQTINRMVSYFARHEVDKKGKDWGNASNPSAGYIAWLLWGGDAGKTWANSIANREKKDKSMSVTDFATSYAKIIKQEKQEDGTLLVYGKATDDALDIDNQICDAGWLNKAMPEWFKTGGNIREQHSNIAAGVAKELDSKADGHYISALVVDASSIKKVETGVLKGFSIGIRSPRVVRDEKAANGRIIDGQIVEVSLVDRPANPNAKLMLAKSDGMELKQMEEMVEQELPADAKPTVEETPVTETVHADEEKRAYGETAEVETEEGSESGAAEEEVEEAEGKKPLDKAETTDCECEGCSDCATKGGCDEKVCKGHIEDKDMHMEEKEEHMEEKSVNKCLECGCHKPSETHGRDDVSTAVIVSPTETPKSLDTIIPRIDVDGNDVADDGTEEDSDADFVSGKSAISDDTVSAIIEKAVKSAKETVANEINAYKDAVNKLETELATALNKAVSGGPKRSVIKTDIHQLGDLLAQAAEYRAKSAVTSDKDLARGYKELADDFEVKAKALQAK